MKLTTEQTLLKKLRDNLSSSSQEEWIESCKSELSQYNRVELADLLREISVELRPSSVISESDRAALEKLKNTVLNITLRIDKQANIEKINSLKSKISDAPDDIVKSIQAKLDSVEKDALEDNIAASMQDRIANSAKVEKSINALRDKFDLEYKCRTLDADMADRDQARNVKRFQSFVQKESISNLLGGILLLVFSVVLMASMFLDTKQESLEIIKSSFLILLGFFFGQSAKTDKKPGDEK